MGFRIVDTPVSGLPTQRMREAEAHPVGILGEKDAVGLTVVLLLVDNPRPDPLRVVLAMKGIDVAHREPATRLFGILPVDRQADLHVVPPEPSGRPVLRDQREAEALGVIADRRTDLP